MARIVDKGHLDKDHPIFTGRFVLPLTQSHSYSLKKEPLPSEQKSKEEDQ